LMASYGYTLEEGQVGNLHHWIGSRLKPGCKLKLAPPRTARIASDIVGSAWRRPTCTRGLE
jgi:hypothetical protein